MSAHGAHDVDFGVFLQRWIVMRCAVIGGKFQKAAIDFLRPFDSTGFGNVCPIAYIYKDSAILPIGLKRLFGCNTLYHCIGFR